MRRTVSHRGDSLQMSDLLALEKSWPVVMSEALSLLLHRSFLRVHKNCDDSLCSTRPGEGLLGQLVNNHLVMFTLSLISYVSVQTRSDLYPDGRWPRPLVKNFSEPN